MISMLATAVAAVAILLGSVLWATVSGMCKDEVRTRLSRLPYLLIRVASLRIPCTARTDMVGEWDAELDFILRGTEGLPLTRLLRGVTYSADLLLRGAPAVAREITAATNGNELASGPNGSVGLTNPDLHVEFPFMTRKKWAKFWAAIEEEAANRDLPSKAIPEYPAAWMAAKAQGVDLGDQMLDRELDARARGLHQGKSNPR